MYFIQICTERMCVWSKFDIRKIALDTKVAPFLLHGATY